MKNNPIELIDDLKVIRTIHSNKARLFGVYNLWYAIITIVIAVFVTFIGFSGAENFAKLFNDGQNKNQIIQTIPANQDLINNSNIDTVKHKIDLNENSTRSEFDFKSKVKMIMDLMTLSILVISILGLIFQFEKKANKHKSAILRLTELISDLAFNYTTAIPASQSFKQEDVKVYAEKYKSLINSLPSTSDNDYFYALKTIQSKKRKKALIMSEEYGKMNFFNRRWKLLWI